MSYLVLYRKYRSQTFGDLVGQDHVVRTLQNGLSSGRIAHSYLFTGPRGTGKTSTARLLAKALNCEKGPGIEPCNVCATCISITEGSCVDVAELDAASESGVDNVRDHIVATTEYQPMMCRFKIFIIDEVHDLSRQAFDALLKTIEEPPAHVVFILATTDYGKVPPTIRARCQKLEFHLASMGDLIKRLTHVAESEGFVIEPSAMTAIARLADGGYRDALTLLEQAMLTTDGTLTLPHVYDHLGLILDETVDELLFAIKAGDLVQLMSILDSIFRSGRDPRAIVDSLMFRLAGLTRAGHGVAVGEGPDAALEASLHEVAHRLGTAEVIRQRSEIAKLHSQIREMTLPRLWLEASLISLSGKHVPETKVAAAERNEPSPQSVVASRGKAPQAASPTPSSEVQETRAVVEEKIDESTELGKAQAIWKRTVGELAKSSDLVRLNLSNSTVESFENGKATVLFSSEVSHDWLANSPKRKKLVLDKLTEVLKTEPWQLHLTFRKVGKPSAPAPPTVELPAEGERLADLAEEVFKNV